MSYSRVHSELLLLHISLLSPNYYLRCVAPVVHYIKLQRAIFPTNLNRNFASHSPWNSTINHCNATTIPTSHISVVKVEDSTTRCASQFVPGKKAVLRVFESQHTAIRISPKPLRSSEYVGCSGQRGAVADDLKAAGPLKETPKNFKIKPGKDCLVPGTSLLCC